MAALWDVSQWDNAAWDNVAGGQQFTSQQGTIAPTLSIALVGQAVTTASGILTANTDGTVALIGQQINGLQGALAPGWDQPLIGSAVVSARGTLGVILRPTDIAGQQINIGQGFVSAFGPDKTVGITGQEITSGQGIINPGGQLLSGTAIVPAAGTMVPSSTVPLVGQQINLAQGTIAPAQDADDVLITSQQGNVGVSVTVALVGQPATVLQGTVVVSSDAFIPLVGSQINSAIGALVATPQIPLTGQQIQSAIQSMGAPGTAALTGQQITVQQGNVSLTNDKDVALTGQQIIVQQGITFASSLAFVTGQTLQVQQQEIGPREATLVGIAIIVGQGVLTPPAPPSPFPDVLPGDGPPKRRRRTKREEEEYEAAQKQRKEAVELWSDIEQDLKDIVAGKGVSDGVDTTTSILKPSVDAGPMVDILTQQPGLPELDEDDEDLLLLSS